MTEPGVERMRTTFLLSSVPPTGVPALMPPPIQEAERRTEHRDRRTRWGLRVLVLGGLAGATWLLAGAAAHAADRTDGPAGSLLGSVIGAGAPVSGLLSVAAQPLESDSPVHLVATVLEVPRRALTGPAEKAAHSHTRTAIDAALGSVDHVLAEVAGPIRLTGGPATTRQSLAPEVPRVAPAGVPASNPILPAAIADSTMASRLLPIASDVEVRRHDAEAPTVSPD